MDFIRDNFSIAFTEDEHSDFDSAVAEFSDAAAWEAIPASDVTFLPMTAIVPEDLSVGGVDAFTDSSVGELPLAVRYDDDGRTFLIRPYLFKNIKQQFRDDAAILSDMLSKGRIDKFCDHLNMSKEFIGKKKLQVMYRGEKISGWFSDFNHNWDQTKQIDFMWDELSSRFPSMKFAGGYISHLQTELKTTLDDAITAKLVGSDSLVADYLDAWEAAGGDREALKNAVPTLQFRTGESGLYAVTASPSLQIPPTPGYTRGRIIPLGSALSVNHRGADNAVWDKFAKFPDNIGTLYVKGLEGLKKMCNTRIFFPYNALTHALKLFKSSIPIAELKRVCDDAEVYFGMDDSTTCSAIDLYNMVNDMVTSVIASKKLSEQKAFQNQEILARLCNMDWKTLDQKTPAKIGGKDTSFEIDFVRV